MSQTDVAIELKPDTEQRPKAATKKSPQRAEKTDTRTQRLPPHSVILHNDPINRFGRVVDILQRTFGYGRGKSFLMTLRAHLLGRSVVWAGQLEVAELKAQQLVGHGPDPMKVARGAKPLKVTVEPMP